MHKIQSIPASRMRLGDLICVEITSPTLQEKIQIVWYKTENQKAVSLQGIHYAC